MLFEREEDNRELYKNMLVAITPILRVLVYTHSYVASKQWPSVMHCHCEGCLRAYGHVVVFTFSSLTNKRLWSWFITLRGDYHHNFSLHGGRDCSLCFWIRLQTRSSQGQPANTLWCWSPSTRHRAFYTTERVNT